MSMTTTGFKALDAALSDLDARGIKSVQRSAVNAGLRVIASAQRAATPVGSAGRKTKKGEAIIPGGLRRSVGSRFAKYGPKGNKVLTGKAGLNVQTRKAQKKGRHAPHAHLVALGTKARKTKSGANRGRVSPNDFARQASLAASGPALKAAEDAAARVLPKAVEQAKRRVR